MLCGEPADQAQPSEPVQVGEGRFGFPVPEVVGPPSQHSVELPQEDGGRIVSSGHGDVTVLERAPLWKVTMYTLLNALKNRTEV